MTTQADEKQGEAMVDLQEIALHEDAKPMTPEQWLSLFRNFLIEGTSKEERFFRDKHDRWRELPAEEIPLPTLHKNSGGSFITLPAGHKFNTRKSNSSDRKPLAEEISMCDAGDGAHWMIHMRHGIVAAVRKDNPKEIWQILRMRGSRRFVEVSELCDFYIEQAQERAKLTGGLKGEQEAEVSPVLASFGQEMLLGQNVPVMNMDFLAGGQILRLSAPFEDVVAPNREGSKECAAVVKLSNLNISSSGEHASIQQQTVHRSIFQMMGNRLFPIIPGLDTEMDGILLPYSMTLNEVPSSKAINFNLPRCFESHDRENMGDIVYSQNTNLRLSSQDIVTRMILKPECNWDWQKLISCFLSQLPDDQSFKHKLKVSENIFTEYIKKLVSSERLSVDHPLGAVPVQACDTPQWRGIAVTTLQFVQEIPSGSVGKDVALLLETCMDSLGEGRIDDERLYSFNPIIEALAAKVSEPDAAVKNDTLVRVIDSASHLIKRRNLPEVWLQDRLLAHFTDRALEEIGDMDPSRMECHFTIPAIQTELAKRKAGRVWRDLSRTIQQPDNSAKNVDARADAAQTPVPARKAQEQEGEAPKTKSGHTMRI